MDPRGQYNLVHLVLRILLILSLVSLNLGSDAASTGIKRGPPSVHTSEVTAIEKKQGENLEFRCSVDGYPLPTLSWFKGGNLLEKDMRISTHAKNLTILLLKVSDSGTYSCRAATCNTNGRNICSQFFLTVIPYSVVTEPIITPMDKQEVRIGTTATFECIVQSSTPTTFEWWKTEEPNMNLRLVPISKKIDIKVNAVQADFYSETLMIFSVTWDDAGNYVCRAENKFGDDAKVAELEVTSAPKKPPPRRGGCMKFGAPGPLALILMAVCGYALGNQMFFD